MKLLFLHGLGQGPDSWNGVIDALGPDTDAACPDLFRLCSEGPDYPSLYAALEGCIEDLPEPVVLCGLSLGAVLALDYATRRPGKVAGLVLIAPQYKMPRGLLRLQNIIFRLMPERAFAGARMGKRDTIRPGPDRGEGRRQPQSRRGTGEAAPRRHRPGDTGGGARGEYRRPGGTGGGHPGGCGKHIDNNE